MYFDTTLSDLSFCRLSDLDLEILEGLEVVLLVSFLLDLDPKMCVYRTTGSSHFSAEHVV